MGTRATMISTYQPGKTPTGVAKELADAYQAKFGKDRWWGDDPATPQVFFSLTVGAGFDCATMLLEAVRLAGGTDRAKVTEALNRISNFPVSNGAATFTPMRRLLVQPENLGMFEYVKGDKNDAVLKAATQ